MRRLTGRSTRTRSGIGPRGLLVSVRLAAQCRCVPVNSDVRPHMEIRLGSPADAEAVAEIISNFKSDLTDDPSGAGAEKYLASVTADAEGGYLASARYRYL